MQSILLNIQKTNYLSILHLGCHLLILLLLQLLLLVKCHHYLAVFYIIAVR